MEFLLLLFSRFFLGYCSVVLVCVVKSKFYFRLIDLFNNLSFAFYCSKLCSFALGICCFCLVLCAVVGFVFLVVI